MKPSKLKVTKIGNSRGIRLPARVLRKYGIKDSLLMEERGSEIVLRTHQEKTLSWKETFKAMAAEKESWREWDGVISDGLDTL